MELQVLYDDQTVKYALIFTGFDQSLFRSILFLFTQIEQRVHKIT